MLKTGKVYSLEDVMMDDETYMANLGGTIPDEENSEDGIMETAEGTNLSKVK